LVNSRSKWLCIAKSTYTLNADCSPNDLSLSAVPGGTGPFTFAWSGPNGFVSSSRCHDIS